MYVLILFLLQIHLGLGANILVINQTPSRSHQIPFQPLWRELSLRGHQVTVLTTDPQKNASLTNLTEIDISYAYEIYNENHVHDYAISDNRSFGEKVRFIGDLFLQCQEKQLSSPEIQDLIHDDGKHFDLVMFESQSRIWMAFGWRFKAPMIVFSSLDAPITYHDVVGNVVHPVVTPDIGVDIEDVENMTFKDRLVSLIYNFLFKTVVPRGFYRHHEQAKRFFGNDLPPFDELSKNISALFVNAHPVIHNLRPSNPNTISIGGGMHIKEPQPLPNDLQKYLDSSKKGVIYFCLGGNIMGSMLPENFMETVLEAFSEIPYNVIMKMDSDIKAPKNVKVLKWVPQQDVLRHPKVKLFVTHGGLQSLQEGIYNGVPTLGIPLCGDAFSNINRMAKLGYGKKVDVKTITKDVLKEAILEVIENPAYRERAQEIMQIYRDEEVPSLERAIYWVEYVIRHKGAKHLRSFMSDLPFWKFYMLDTVGFVLGLFLAILLLAYIIIKIVFKIIYFIVRKMTKTHTD